MRFRALFEKWGGDNEHDGLAHEIIGTHIKPLEQGKRRWYSSVHPGDSDASDGVHADLKSAGWKKVIPVGFHDLMGREDIYSHPSSPNRIHIKRYVKGDVDDPDGVRTVYQARFHSGEDS